MTQLRIVSFLPAATEMVYALGLGDQLAGVSHECDFPPEAKSKPVVVRPALDLKSLSLRNIDVVVAERIRNGASLYQVEESLLRELKPDLILTQNLCQVCATSGNDLTAALKLLQPRPQVLFLTPHSIADIFDNIRELGEATGRLDKAKTFIAKRRGELERIGAQAKPVSRRPSVFCVEWADPVYCSGHWVPEMVKLAGGIDELAREGTDSVRIRWSDVIKYAPEILIFSPCGFNLGKALEQIPLLESLPGWAELPAVRNGRVYAVDANSYFARPGPRVVDGVALLAHLIHPELFDWNGPQEAYRKSSSRNAHSPKTRIKSCPRCGQTFQCKAGNCWCEDFAPLSPCIGPNVDCLCPACLAKALNAAKS